MLQPRLQSGRDVIAYQAVTVEPGVELAERARALRKQRQKTERRLGAKQLMPLMKSSLPLRTKSELPVRRYRGSRSS